MPERDRTEERRLIARLRTCGQKDAPDFLEVADAIDRLITEVDAAKRVADEHWQKIGDEQAARAGAEWERDEARKALERLEASLTDAFGDPEKIDGRYFDSLDQARLEARAVLASLTDTNPEARLDAANKQ